MKITWYCPESNFSSYPNKIEEANFRIRVWYNHNFFLQEGHQSILAHKKEDVTLSDILVLTSFGEDCFELARMFKLNGKKVVHDYSENIRGIPILEATKRLCDKIICCSTWLKDEEAKVYGSKSVSVDGPYEPSPVRHDPDYENSPLKVVWCGNGGNAGMVRSLLKPIVDSLGMEYVEISNLPDSSVIWKSYSWYYHYATCDIALCPHDHWRCPAKGNNKVITAMGMGLPVVASPVLSSLELIQNGVNGYICYELEDWKNALSNLKSKDHRFEIIKNYPEIVKKHTTYAIYLRWKKEFEELLS